MALEGGERLVLNTLRDLQGDSTDYVDDARLASATKMFVEDVRDFLVTLEGKGFVERARKTAGFSADVTAKGKLELRLMEPIANSMPGTTVSGASSVSTLSCPTPLRVPRMSSAPLVVNSSLPTGEETSSRDDSYHVVLLIHGIRTQAEWQSMVKAKLEVPGQIEVISIRYGYFDAFRLWFPPRKTSRLVESLYNEIQLATRIYMRSHTDAKISIIASGAGTYILGQILKRGFYVQLHRLILRRSFLKSDYQWAKYHGRFNHNNTINECCSDDIGPVLAKTLSWSYGDSGTKGFGGDLVKNRFHTGGPGQYFEPGFIEKYWEPFISKEVIMWAPTLRRRGRPRLGGCRCWRFSH